MSSVPDARMTLLAKRVLAVLTDDWTPQDEVLAKVVPQVPPGRALRAYLRIKAANDAERNKRIAEGKKALPQRVRTEAEQIETGARDVVRGILTDFRKNARVDVEVVDGVRCIRLSKARAYAHHCCLHGGSCRGKDAGEVVGSFKRIPNDDPLAELIRRVLESRRKRLAQPPAPTIREVVPGEIDRLLREAG